MIPKMWIQKSKKAIVIGKRHPKALYSTLLLTVFISILLLLTLVPNFPGTSASTPSAKTTLQEPTMQSDPQFKVEIIYAYAGPLDHSTGRLNSIMNMSGTTYEMHPASEYPDIIYFNFTFVSNPLKEECDAKTEVYLVELSSDTGVTEKFAVFFGTNYNPSFGSKNSIQAPSISKIDNLIDLNTTARVSGLFCPNMPTNQSLWFKVGTYDTTTSLPSGLGLWKSGEPNSITVTIHRVGWLSLTGTITSVIQSNSTDSLQYNLSKSSQGFMYNNIPEKDFLQKDAFHPIDLTKPLS